MLLKCRATRKPAFVTSLKAADFNFDKVASFFVFGSGSISHSELELFDKYLEEANGSKHVLYSRAFPLYESIQAKLKILKSAHSQVQKCLI